MAAGGIPPDPLAEGVPVSDAQVGPDGLEDVSEVREVADLHKARIKKGGRRLDTSEKALALSFAQDHADNLRYVKAWGRWFIWNNYKWCRDQTMEGFDRVSALCATAAEGCDGWKEVKELKSARTAKGVEALAQADRRMAATVEQWDTDPWLLNTPGGVVDLRSGLCRPARCEDYMLKATAVAPAAECDCPLWRDFLKRATDGDDELQDYLQRVLGYSLTGDTSEQAIFFIYGPSASGKSVFVETITGVLGDYAVAAPVDAFMAVRGDRHPTDLAGLVGARLVTASETEPGQRWAEARVKMLSGGDTITARFMRQDFFSFTPTFKLLIAGNHRPSIRNVNAALRRRLHMIVFPNPVPEDSRDREMREKLRAEWPGILRWAIEGCAAWVADGLAPPATIASAVEDYFVAEDVVGRWLDERCALAPEATCTTATLFADWKSWAEAAGEYVGSTKRFAGVLHERGFARWRQSGTGKMGFRGITLARSDDWDGSGV